MYTFAYFNNISLDSKSITCEFHFSLLLFYFSSFCFKPTISYLTSMDIYAITCIFALVIQCIWHAIIGAIIFLNTPDDKLTRYMWYTYCDRYVFIGLFVIFIIKHIILITWLYLVPFKLRKDMVKKDIEYELSISKKNIGRNSKAVRENRGNSPPFTRIPIATNA
jgi:hypothetical protein